MEAQRRKVAKYPKEGSKAPAKFLAPFLPTAPLQYVPKMLFIQATIDCLSTNKTKNALHNETVILNYTLVLTQLVIAWVINHL